MDARTLEKMTILKLREEALKIPDVVGVHGMNKEELLILLKKHFDIPIEKERKATESVRAIKGEIKDLKKNRLAALEAKDAKKAIKLRRKIKKLKRKTRKIAV